MRTMVRCVLAVALLAMSGLVSAADGLTIHVAPTGNDTWSGTLAQPNAEKTDGPVASLVGARDALRKLRAGKASDKPVRVIVADGRYAFTEALTLAPEDGGTKEAPVSYEAAPGARPILSGGRVIIGFRADKDGLWVADVPDVAAGKWYFEQLFVNGRRATRARTPNKFWFHPQKIAEEKLAGEKNAKRAKEARHTVWLRTEDVSAIAQLTPDELKDVNMVVYHNWDNTRRFIDAIDTKEHTVVTSGEGMKPWNPWRKDSTIIFENYKGALDAPGEWFLARDGKLYYMPRPGEDMAKAEVVAPVSEKFVILKGDPAGGKYVEYVTFKGLTFHHAQWLTPPKGFEPAQAAAPIEAVFQADGARHVTIEDCEIGHVGIYVVWFRKGCTDNAVRRCYLFDFGAGGVRIGEMGDSKKEAENTARNVIDNNIIRHGGFIFPCAVGVWVGFSPDNEITHNEIADLFYSALSVGWRWGYAESNCKRNKIQFNHAHHLGKGLLSDMGGIYTLGPSEGTVVSNNIFHDIYAYSYGGWGMYTDEGSTGILFENNLVYDTKTGSFHQHYGKENVIRNNIMCFSKQHQVQVTRVEQHLSFTFENNIVYWTTGPALAGQWDKVKTETRNNWYWNAAGAKVQFLGKSLEDWQKAGHEKGTVIVDPLFENAEQRDFRLKADSPVLKTGFKPFDFTKAGVYGDAAWIAKANEVKYPPLELAPDRAPVPLTDSFEHDPVGKSPPNVEVHAENKGDSIVVTEETAAEGKRSIKITDAPGLQNAWNPHLCWKADYAKGAIENGFDIRVEKASKVDFEWRDWSEGDYKTGPSFGIHDCKLRLNGGATLDLPENQWVRFEIAGVAGEGNAAKWSLTVKVSGQDTKVFKDLSYAKPNFKKLTWVGFTSNATEKTSFFLDSFALKLK